MSKPLAAWVARQQKSWSMAPEKSQDQVEILGRPELTSSYDVTRALFGYDAEPIAICRARYASNSTVHVSVLLCKIAGVRPFPQPARKAWFCKTL